MPRTEHYGNQEFWPLAPPSGKRRTKKKASDEQFTIGDFNFDINTGVHVRRSRGMLNCNDMTLYVETATHQEGHI